MNINKQIKTEKKISKHIIDINYPIKDFNHMISATVSYEKGKLLVFIEYESKEKVTYKKFC